MNKSREKGIFRVTILGSVVNLLLTVIKFIAGVMGHSAAMVADAVHSLSDLATDAMVLVFVKISGKPQDEGHDFGHGKYETFGTIIISIMLLAVSVGIFWSGATKIYAVFVKGETLPRPEMLAFWAAVVSILLKEILFQYTKLKGKVLNSDALIANAWHHRSDALSSIGTAIGIGGAIMLGDRWTVLDPIAAIVVSLLIVKVSFDLLKPAVDELMEKSLPKEIEDEILAEIATFTAKGVHDAHDLRTRKVGNYYCIQVDVRMENDTTIYDAHKTATEIENWLKEKYGQQTMINIHLEPLIE